MVPTSTPAPAVRAAMPPSPSYGRLAAALLAPLVLAALPVRAQTAAGFYGTRGTAIVDPAGNPVVLRGVGLGGWLMPEGYMLHIAAPDGGSPRTIRAQIEGLIGRDGADEFFRRYRANYVEEKDVAAVAAWGYDHVRLPFHYDVLFDAATGTFKEDGFALLDTFLGWCRRYGVEVILDLHATPGAQNHLNISDSDGTARLWTEPVPYQDQTVALWAEIARRYKDERLIIGYDLINEPVLPSSVPGSALRALYVRIAQAVRAVDPNHILFIEGNHFATDFSALGPPLDSNMVYAFHKYWNGTGQNTIQYLLDLRAAHDVPLWLGETGENTNPWFHAVRTLAEVNGISWNWWMHKKIETTSAPLSAPFAPGYASVVAYWRGQGPRPSTEGARNALYAMADGLDLDSCDARPDVLAALFRDDFATTPRPYRDHRLPGVVNAADFDLGNQGVSYSDADYINVSGSPSGPNQGGQYRNDGVDIERSFDPQGFRYHVSHLNPSEYLDYTIRVDTAGQYDVEFRVASTNGATAARGALSLLVGESTVGTLQSVPATGGFGNWQSVYVRGVALPAGTHRLRVFVRAAGFNLNRMRFTLVSPTDADGPAVPGPAWLVRSYPNPTRGAFTVAFETPAPARARVAVYDLLGREVFVSPDVAVGTGAATLPVRPDLRPGTYVYRLVLDGDGQRRTFQDTLTVAR